MFSQVVFYYLDKVLRTYRKMMQASFDRAGIGITIDQWLILRIIETGHYVTQAEIAKLVHKDQASVARMVALLVKQNMVLAQPVPTDARRTNLVVTPKGLDTLTAAQPIIHDNRRVALEGVPEEHQELMRTTLERMYQNCLAAAPEA